MGVFKYLNGYRWEFQKDGKTYKGDAPTRKEATDAEGAKRLELRGMALMPKAGKPDFLCPTITEWAGIYFAETKAEIERHPNNSEKKKAKQIHTLYNTLKVALRFWGAKPEQDDERMNRNTTTKDLRPYHDLRLDDPIKDITWLPAFDKHLVARGVANQTINNQRYAMSNLYKHALKTEHRLQTGIVVNPFRDLEKKTARRRRRTVTIEEFMAIYAEAAPHLQLALDIGVYAYALRHAEVLGLTTDNLDKDLTTITVWEHKGSGEDAIPKTIPISDELRRVLQAALADPTRNRKCKAIVQYPQRGQDGVKGGIETYVGRALRGAVERAGLVYGITDPEGITFHTLRHTMGTQAAKDGIDAERRRKMLGHASMAATNWYSHADADTHRPDVEAFNARIADARRGAKVGPSQTRTPPKSPPKVLLKSVLPFRGQRRAAR